MERDCIPAEERGLAPLSGPYGQFLGHTSLAKAAALPGQQSPEVVEGSITSLEPEEFARPAAGYDIDRIERMRAEAQGIRTR